MFLRDTVRTSNAVQAVIRWRAHVNNISGMEVAKAWEVHHLQFDLKKKDNLSEQAGTGFFALITADYYGCSDHGAPLDIALMRNW